MMSAEDIFTKGLSEFVELFGPTIELAERLIQARTNAQEVVLLLCARLDALASALVVEGTPNHESFARLVVKYGGHRELMESVSAGDIYYELGYHRWLIEGTIPKPGRLVRFSRVDDPIIYLLDHSGVPITVEDGTNLFTRMMRAVETAFRCKAGQPRSKPTCAKRKAFSTALEQEFARSKNDELKSSIGEASRLLLDSKTIAALMYQRFRNEAIHGGHVLIDEERFFTETAPYWKPLVSEYYPAFLVVEFPARFLIDVLRNCLRTVCKMMEATRKLPPDIHFHVFGAGLDHLEFLDQDLILPAVELRHKR
jgi:hypothetical protein